MKTTTARAEEDALDEAHTRSSAQMSPSNAGDEGHEAEHHEEICHGPIVTARP